MLRHTLTISALALATAACGGLPSARSGSILRLWSRAGPAAPALRVPHGGGDARDRGCRAATRRRRGHGPGARRRRALGPRRDPRVGRSSVRAGGRDGSARLACRRARWRRPPPFREPSLRGPRARALRAREVRPSDALHDPARAPRLRIRRDRRRYLHDWLRRETVRGRRRRRRVGARRERRSARPGGRLVGRLCARARPRRSAARPLVRRARALD